MSETHKYILFGDTRPGYVSEVSFDLIGTYLHGLQNRKKWKNDKKLYQVSWLSNDGQPQKSQQINYRVISSHIRENGHFDHKHFDLPWRYCFWLDFTLDTKINWHMFEEGATDGLAIHDGIPQQQYGNKYPIQPKLIREGHSYTTLQPQLMARITRLRNKLIAESHNALSDDWFFDFRSLISDTVSLVEITLTQLYIKAEYDPLFNWKFDLDDLGVRHGRRFRDKLKWIYKISGNHLSADQSLSKFNVLRKLRNHLMHFDPPSLVLTIEESTMWLNCILDVGDLLVEIRKCIGAEISTQLLNFTLQKQAVFNPEFRFSKRLAIGSGNSDYSSSIWPDSNNYEEE